MKLPENAHMDEIKRVAGTKTLVPMTTGLTNTLKRRMWPYDTAALVNVNMTRSGIVWRNVVYGSGKLRGTLEGLRVRKRAMNEERTHVERPVNQIEVQIGS
jgi:hypothetical protein